MHCWLDLWLRGNGKDRGYYVIDLRREREIIYILPLSLHPSLPASQAENSNFRKSAYGGGKPPCDWSNDNQHPRVQSEPAPPADVRCGR